MKMINVNTGELQPAEIIGRTRDGNFIVHRPHPWDLCRDDGGSLHQEQEAKIEYDEDGNCILDPFDFPEVTALANQQAARRAIEAGITRGLRMRQWDSTLSGAAP